MWCCGDCRQWDQLPEVVDDAALTVDPFDVDAIRSAIKKVINDSALRRVLSVKGQERAGEFNWRETARKTRRSMKKSHGPR